MKTRILTTLIAVVALTGCPKTATEAIQSGPPDKNAGVTDRPEDIKFPALSYTPPAAADFRHELKSGVPVYVATSTEFPLVEISLTFKGGRYLAPDDKWGIGSAASELIRHGGAGSTGADDLDETFAYLAADVSVFVGSEQSGATLNCLKDNLPEALALFTSMVREPAFDQDKLDLQISNTVERFSQRNDDASDIASREWAALVYGRDHYRGRSATAEQVQSITQDDLKAFHAQIFHPGNLVVSVTGDVTAEEILPILEKTFSGWEKAETVAEPPAPTVEIEGGVYHIAKDIPQGKVRIGLRGLQRGDEQYFAAEVMNHVLGGGGFTSRLMSRIRSDEGLAYGARSRFSYPVHYPGVFIATYDSKNPTVARAAQIVYEEFERMKTTPLTDEELALAKTAYIETFPRRFESKAALVSTFVDDEITARDADYWQTYREKIAAVTADDVLAIAKSQLLAENMAFFIVGDWDPINKGDLEGKANMSEFGEVSHLPLRDPLTQEPI